MFDPKLLPATRKILDLPARLLVRAGVSADQVTITGFIIGLLAVPFLAFELYELALTALVFYWRRRNRTPLLRACC